MRNTVVFMYGGGAVAGEKDIVMKTQGNNELGDNKKKKITSKTG